MPTQIAAQNQEFDLQLRCGQTVALKMNFVKSKCWESLQGSINKKKYKWTLTSQKRLGVGVLLSLLLCRLFHVVGCHRLQMELSDDCRKANKTWFTVGRL